MAYLLEGGNTKPFTLNITPRMNEALSYMADQNGMTRGPYTRMLLANALAKEGALNLKIDEKIEKVI